MGQLELVAWKDQKIPYVRERIPTEDTAECRKCPNSCSSRSFRITELTNPCASREESEAGKVSTFNYFCISGFLVLSEGKHQIQNTCFTPFSLHMPPES